MIPEPALYFPTHKYNGISWRPPPGPPPRLLTPIWFQNWFTFQVPYHTYNLGERRRIQSWHSWGSNCLDHFICGIMMISRTALSMFLRRHLQVWQVLSVWNVPYNIVNRAMVFCVGHVGHVGILKTGPNRSPCTLTCPTGAHDVDQLCAHNSLHCWSCAYSTSIDESDSSQALTLVPVTV